MPQPRIPEVPGPSAWVGYPGELLSPQTAGGVRGVRGRGSMASSPPRRNIDLVGGSRRSGRARPGRRVRGDPARRASDEPGSAPLVARDRGDWDYAAFRLLYGLMLRAPRASPPCSSVTATFPSRPPSRAAIAWAMPDTLRLRRGLDELSKGAWTPESQSRRAALVAALWALDESIRHPGLLWRSSDRDTRARVWRKATSPGCCKSSLRHRSITGPSRPGCVSPPSLCCSRAWS